MRCVVEKNRILVIPETDADFELMGRGIYNIWYTFDAEDKLQEGLVISYKPKDSKKVGDKVDAKVSRL